MKELRSRPLRAGTSKFLLFLCRSTENAVRNLHHAAAGEDPERRGGPVHVRVPAAGGQQPAEGSLQPHAAGQQPGQPGQQHQRRRRQQQSQRLQRRQTSTGRPETQLQTGRQEVRRSEGGGAGSGGALRRPAVSLRRYLFQIQLCLMGEQE